MDITGSPTEDYVSFFLRYPLASVWQLFLLGLGRIVPIVAIAPFFGSKLIPDSAKLVFSFILVPLFLPFIFLHSHGPMAFDLLFFIMVIKEVVIGFILAFLIAIPFYFVEGAGSIIDHQRGVQSLQVMDPTSTTQVTSTGLLYNNVFIVIFYLIGGPLLFFQALLTSYQVFPADQFLSASFFAADQPMWNIFFKTFTTILTFVIQLAAPSLITILMSDLFLGITNRMAPQVQITFLLWSLKAYLGIAILWAAWAFIMKQMDGIALQWIKMVTKLLHDIGLFMTQH